MRRTPSTLILALLGSALIYSTPAFAYLDPGTGSILLQGLIATVAGIIVAARLYWQRVKAFFSGIMPGGNSDDATVDESASAMDPAADEANDTDNAK